MNTNQHFTRVMDEYKKGSTIEIVGYIIGQLFIVAGVYLILLHFTGDARELMLSMPFGDIGKQTSCQILVSSCIPIGIGLGLIMLASVMARLRKLFVLQMESHVRLCGLISKKNEG